MNQSLIVYKASAGSGKTFTLATEYIRLLIEDPTSFRHILAVTFTNKATAEMKNRVLSQLYGIAHGLESSRSYADHVCKATRLPLSAVEERAAMALQGILHHYHEFRIETIDSFFQRILRNLARELDLAMGMRVELNDCQVEEEAVDQMIEQLEEGSRVMDWIMAYIRDNIEQDKAWNVVGNIKSFGINIFKDFYKESSARIAQLLDDDKAFKDYRSHLHALKAEAQKALQGQADQFFQALEDRGFNMADLSRGTGGPASFFVKLRGGQWMDKGNNKLVGSYVQQAMNDPAAWVKKSQTRPGLPLYDLACDVLTPLLLQTEEMRHVHLRTINSVDLTLGNLHQLRLLKHIDEKVHSMNRDDGRFTLSDTQNLLARMIGDDDVPFIYEKTGTRIHHIMIDEFQDTSTIQWNNFRTLLLECMSHRGSHNLIVGDVKQSIYRWRSGDWRLLNDIEKQFPAQQSAVEVRSLTTNYRSCRNIIEFNNLFFEKAVQAEASAFEDFPEAAQMFRKAYADVQQQVPENKGHEGEVYVSLLLDKEFTQEDVFARVEETIDHLLAHGAKPGDIAIIERGNKDIRDLAHWFHQYRPDLPLVSDEAFQLGASPAVCILVEAMRVLHRPGDTLADASLRAMLERTVQSDNLLDSIDTFHQEREHLLSLSLFDLANRLFALFQLERLSDATPYICTFFDKLSRFSADNVADLDSFLRAWDAHLAHEPVQSSETNGIRLITIHKCKGLEFQHVIISNCNWRLEKTDTIWVSPQEKPYSDLALVPVEYSANKMKASIYAADYNQEHLQNMVDNLNLLYVAFTRACQSLWIISRKPEGNRRGGLLQAVLPQVAEAAPGKAWLHDELEEISFGFGCTDLTDGQGADTEPATDEPEATEDSCPNVFLAPSRPLPCTIHTYTSRAEYRQSNQSREFLMSTEEEDTAEDPAHASESQQAVYIKMGNVMHRLLSRIETLDDLGPELQRLENDGVLYDDTLPREQLANMLRKRFNNPQVREWFSPGWTVINECTIASRDPETGGIVHHRPDRVITQNDRTLVIDFKFGKPLPEHQEQVSRYIQLLRQMGHTHVEGRLWYVYSNEIVNND